MREEIALPRPLMRASFCPLPLSLHLGIIELSILPLSLYGLKTSDRPCGQPSWHVFILGRKKVFFNKKAFSARQYLVSTTPQQILKKHVKGLPPPP